MATFTMPSLPRLGKSSGAVHACICGCGMPTRRTWHAGHDGRATGWAMRIERGVIALVDVPANERKGAEFMLLRRAAEAKAEAAKAVKIG